jgi:nucleoid-associated protein YgaU
VASSPGPLGGGGTITQAKVRINPVQPNMDARSFQLAATAPARSDGLGGWQEITRERRKSLTEFTGAAVDKLDVTVKLDGYPTVSVQNDVDWITDLGRKSGVQTPVFVLTGPVWMSGQQFVLDTMDWGDFERTNQGVLVRQELTLHCWRYLVSDTSILSSPAKKHTQGGKHPKTYTVKAGDTLQSIAAKVYGDPSKWHDIATLNGLRDPNYLKPGQVLKLP